MFAFRKREQGMALLLAMMAFIVVAGLIATLFTNLRTAHKDITLEIATQGQALNIADAGLVDVLNWFRRYYSVRGKFDPQKDTTVDPVINETDDPRIGLVREHVISESPYLVGRYEIRRLTVDVGTSTEAEIDPVNGVKDIKAQRKSVKPVFYLQCNSYIFSLKVNKNLYNPTLFYNTKDHEGEDVPDMNNFNTNLIRLHARGVMAAEVVQSQIKLPYDAAVCHGGSMVVYTRGEVYSYEATAEATAYLSGDGTGKASTSGGKISPSPDTSANYGTGDDSVESVFGLDNEEALSVGSDKTLFPDISGATFAIPEYRYTFIGDPGGSLKNFTFDSGTPLNAKNAVVYIRGNVTLAAGNNSFFSGLLYVVGNLTVRDPCYISGAVIVKGNVTVQGSSDAATIIYQKNIISDLQAAMGAYTYYRPPYVIPQNKKEKILIY